MEVRKRRTVCMGFHSIETCQTTEGGDEGFVAETHLCCFPPDPRRGSGTSIDQRFTWFSHQGLESYIILGRSGCTVRGQAHIRVRRSTKRRRVAGTLFPDDRLVLSSHQLFGSKLHPLSHSGLFPSPPGLHTLVVAWFR